MTLKKILNEYVNDDISNIIIDYNNQINFNEFLDKTKYLIRDMKYNDKQIIIRYYSKYKPLTILLSTFLDKDYLDKCDIGGYILIDEYDMISYYVECNYLVYYENVNGIKKGKHKDIIINIQDHEVLEILKIYYENLLNKNHLIKCCCSVDNLKDNAFLLYNNNGFIIIGSKCVNRFKNEELDEYVDDNIMKNKKLCLICYKGNLRGKKIIHSKCYSRCNYNFNCYKLFFRYNRGLIRKFMKNDNINTYKDINYNNIDECNLILKCLKYKYKKEERYFRQIEKSITFITSFIEERYGDIINL